MTTSLADRLRTLPMSEFAMNWRFTDPEYDVLPPEHLAQVHPLDDQSAELVWKLIIDSDIHAVDPFKPGFFRHIESIEIEDSTEGEEEDARIRKWLYQCALPLDHVVYLSWQPTLAVQTTWKMMVKYWSSFYYPISDDLSVIDESLDWCLLFHHEHEIHFGTNRPRIVSDQRNEPNSP